METDQADADLLLLSLSLSDSEPEEAATPSNTTTAASSTAPTTEHQPTRAERTALSEEAFQALKQTYRPKIENGNVQPFFSLSFIHSLSPSLSRPFLLHPTFSHSHLISSHLISRHLIISPSHSSLTHPPTTTI
ncbi:hypothetical protein N658DRAFT_521215 [Parathielavia hyrcaniae]|uniref:Uncharacterized protein n=1 Tax=Parathielavia hyrcaniae TaxID=113614 RepID=A0AAN6QA80_9PEZI|nr:hypothetical protein N658DRAFT_521215 [Parathielavia hyrcaniae]